MWFHFKGSFKINTAKKIKTMIVMASCVIFNCYPLIPSIFPIRLAGTINIYSTNAINQLIRITFHNATCSNFKCPYHAIVMKTLEIKSNNGFHGCSFSAFFKAKPARISLFNLAISSLVLISNVSVSAKSCSCNSNCS